MTAPTPNAALVDRAISAAAFAGDYVGDERVVLLETVLSILNGAALASPQEGWVLVECGDRLFEFTSKAHWVNQASRIWRFHEVRSEDTLVLDRLGRPVQCGKHFMDSERDDAYPITVYRLRKDMNPSPSQPAEKGGG